MLFHTTKFLEIIMQTYTHLPPSLPSSLPPSFSRQDPGYPHAADGNNRPSTPGNERLMLNITYVHPSFPHGLRRHVISHLEYYKQHLPRSVWM